MGRRRNRKRERRNAGRDENGAVFAPPRAFAFDEDEMLLLLQLRSPVSEPAVATTCGTCTEFVEDMDAGRGACLHPGSGVLAPWPDTPSCPFHNRRRGR